MVLGDVSLCHLYGQYLPLDIQVPVHPILPMLDDTLVQMILPIFFVFLSHRLSLSVWVQPSVSEVQRVPPDRYLLADSLL